MKKTIGERIRAQRILLGMSQEELANRLGLQTRGALSHIESSRRGITAEQLRKIAEILHTTPNHLLGFDETKQEVIQTATDVNKSFMVWLEESTDDEKRELLERLRSLKYNKS